jgi:hypothetical protein
VAVVLIVLGCVLAPLGGVAVWARNQVTKTDRSVRTVAPLAADPAIQQAIADQITTQIFTYIDVQALTNQALDALTERGLRPRLPTQLRARRPFPTIGPPTRPWTRMQLPRSCRCPDRGGADQRARPRDRRHSGGRPRDRL